MVALPPICKITLQGEFVKTICSVNMVWFEFEGTSDLKGEKREGLVEGGAPDAFAESHAPPSAPAMTGQHPVKAYPNHPPMRRIVRQRRRAPRPLGRSRPRRLLRAQAQHHNHHNKSAPPPPQSQLKMNHIPDKPVVHWP